MPIYYKVIHGETIDKRKLKPFTIKPIESPGDNYTGWFINLNIACDYSVDNGTTWITKSDTSSTQITLTGFDNSIMLKNMTAIPTYTNLIDIYATTRYGNAQGLPRVELKGNIKSILVNGDFADDNINPDSSTTRLDGYFINKYCVVYTHNLILCKPWRDSSYSGMFSGAANLLTAPTLVVDDNSWFNESFNNMFGNCTKLQEVVINSESERPGLSYNSNTPTFRLTFSGCSSLNKITLKNIKYWTNIYNYSAFRQWVEGVSSSGIFVCEPELPKEYGTYNIPKGWTVEEI